MSNKSYTPGPWRAVRNEVWVGKSRRVCPNVTSGESLPLIEDFERAKANARLIAAAPTMHNEMVRYLEIIERAEADPQTWAKLTEGTGIATANAYRAAIARATEVPDV